MTQFWELRPLACGLLLTAAIALPARAEGSYEIPAGAHFNKDKLAQGRRVLQERGSDRQDLRRDRPDPAARQARLSRVLRRAGRRQQGADDRQDHLPPVFDDEGDHRGRVDATARGRQDQARRPRLEIHSVFRQCEGRLGEEGRGRRARARADRSGSPDDGARPDDPHLRYHLWLLRRQPGAQGVSGGRDLQGRFRSGRVR